MVGEAPSARLAPAMLDRTRPAVVLLDLRLADGSECDGLSLCATITQRYPDIRVLVLTSSADEWLILESIQQGAKGFVVKDVDLTELVRAIRAVHRGESAFDSRSAESGRRRRRAGPAQRGTITATDRPPASGSSSPRCGARRWASQRPAVISGRRRSAAGQPGHDVLGGAVQAVEVADHLHAVA